MTTSYVAGTVSVPAGGRTVTGIGTGWLTANIAPGFFALQGAVGPVIPVERIVSDTELLLYVDWPGATVSGAGYWLSYDTRDGQQTVNNAIRLSEYIARLDSDSLTALASLMPAADKIPYFNSDSTAVLTDFPAAARELLAGTGVLPNSQLPTRLSPLATSTTDLNTINETGWAAAFDTSANTPFPGFYLVHTEVWVDGAYAVQTAYSIFSTESAFRRHKLNGVWQPWKASGQATLGSVTQSSGVPTGAIIERGSNSNGEYTRFADGTQICWRTATLSYTSSNELAATVSFPSAFFGNPIVSVSPTQVWPSGSTRNFYMRVVVAGRNNGVCALSAYNDTGNNQSGDTYNADLTAIGRWF